MWARIKAWWRREVVGGLHEHSEGFKAPWQSCPGCDEEKVHRGA